MLRESWTRGRHTHLLVDPGCPREDWHPSSAPEKAVMDGVCAKQQSMLPRPFMLLPAGASPPQLQGTRVPLNLLPDYGFKLFGSVCPKQTPSWDVSCRGRLSNSKSEEESSAIEPQGWV